MPKKLKLALVTLISLVGLIIVVSFAFAQWQEPTLPPPEGQVPAPINVGAVNQYKEGYLAIGTGEVHDDAALYARSTQPFPNGHWAGYFEGNVNITGDLNVGGNIIPGINLQSVLDTGHIATGDYGAEGMKVVNTNGIGIYGIGGTYGGYFEGTLGVDVPIGQKFDNSGVAVLRENIPDWEPEHFHHTNTITAVTYGRDAYSGNWWEDSKAWGALARYVPKEDPNDDRAYGVYGKAQNTGPSYGVYGQGSTAGVRGIKGSYQGYLAYANAGVAGYGYESGSIGVFGQSNPASGKGYGVYGKVGGEGVDTAYGGYFKGAIPDNTKMGYGVYAYGGVAPDCILVVPKPVCEFPTVPFSATGLVPKSYCDTVFTSTVNNNVSACDSWGPGPGNCDGTHPKCPNVGETIDWTDQQCADATEITKGTCDWTGPVADCECAKENGTYGFRGKTLISEEYESVSYKWGIGTGVHAIGGKYGVFAKTLGANTGWDWNTEAGHFEANRGIGVYAKSTNNIGVRAEGGSYGVYGKGQTAGVYGEDSNNSGYGYVGYGNYGVYGRGSTGVIGFGSGAGVVGQGLSGGDAAHFIGDVLITGNLIRNCRSGFYKIENYCFRHSPDSGANQYREGKWASRYCTETLYGTFGVRATLATFSEADLYCRENATNWCSGKAIWLNDFSSSDQAVVVTYDGSDSYSFTSMPFQSGSYKFRYICVYDLSE